MIMLVIIANIMLPEVKAQSVADLLQQLALNYQKLAEMKKVLGQMYNTYSVLNNGYNSVKSVAEGNTELHRVFLDGLMKASPAVRKYPRAGDIIRDQASLISEYRQAYGMFRMNRRFSREEIDQMTRVYDQLVARSLENLSELTIVMTDSKLRMSDGERLTSIDNIYREGHEQLTFLRKFNDQVYRTSLMREKVDQDREQIRGLYYLKK